LKRYTPTIDRDYSYDDPCAVMEVDSDGCWCDLADAESELSTLRARVAELEAKLAAAQQDSAKIRRVAIRDLQRDHLDRAPEGTLLCYWTPSSRTVVVTGAPAGDEHNCDAMGCGQEHVVERIDIGALETRLAALEAPPVVPYAWHVEIEGGEWVLRRDDIRIVGNYGGTENAKCMAHNLACLVYAIRNNARPRHWADEITPHESDGEVTP
jgi:hypothetical protein